ncbi:MAG: phospho-sugar mutase [Chitinivibrionales bacterium]|nr:phospho-sugar mutase [Chitinivibrionales bacterium]
MDEQTIRERAEQYVAAEDNAVFRNEVEELLRNADYGELNERFYTGLDFGTGGLRGVIGGGMNRMNTLVVQRATQGLATYVKAHAGAGEPSAVIAYDSRRYSETFALDAALVLCGNGIKTYLFSSLRPTPELSFAVRRLKATTGIVVTASHNPPQYNGYKVYWDDGGQVVSPHDKGIIEEVRKVESVTKTTRDQAIADGLLVLIDSEIDNAYRATVVAQSLRPDLVREKGGELQVVYTPLHGTGGMLVDSTLRELGVEVTFVEEQREPDGEFPTVDYPNPEESSAMELALRKAKEIGADLVLGTDPDADRVGMAAPDGDTYRLLTGNQHGVLLADYVLGTHKELGTMPKNPAFIKTIVTTELQRLVAESYGATVHETLTGFKYIAAKIREFESQPGGPTFVVGGEESYGFLVGTAVRDKDAVSAAAMTVEMALYYRSQGKSLMERLNEIYREHGYFEELLVSKYFEGSAGLEKMNAIMEHLRRNPPSTFAGQPVVAMKDYREGTTTILSSGETNKDIELPSSNVVQFFLGDSSIITARPSGTEPKIKFYASCRAEAGTPLEDAKAKVDEKIARITQELNRLGN